MQRFLVSPITSANTASRRPIPLRKIKAEQEQTFLSRYGRYEKFAKRRVGCQNADEDFEKLCTSTKLAVSKISFGRALSSLGTFHAQEALHFCSRRWQIHRTRDLQALVNTPWLFYAREAIQPFGAIPHLLAVPHAQLTTRALRSATYSSAPGSPGYRAKRT